MKYICGYCQAHFDDWEVFAVHSMRNHDVHVRKLRSGEDVLKDAEIDPATLPSREERVAMLSIARAYLRGWGLSSGAPEHEKEGGDTGGSKA